MPGAVLALRFSRMVLIMPVGVDVDHVVLPLRLVPSTRTSL